MAVQKLAKAAAAEQRVLAKFDAYPGMLMALRARAAERQFAVSSEENHNVTGLSDRRITRMLSLQTLKNLETVRRVGVQSLGPLLGFLGAELWLVESPWAMKQFDGRLKKRNENLVHNSVVHVVRTKRDFRKMGLIGGPNSRKNMTAQKASELGRNAALARWRKPKIERQRIRKEAGAAA
jgi:hypothetical protein